jgi:hypothetical protein
MAGRPADAAPISCAGTVLSQPPISTTESMGCARIISSVSIDMRLRRYMLVGCEKLSAMEMVGNSSGRPPGQHDAPLDRVDQLRRIAVARVVGTAGVHDADDGPVERFVRVPGTLDERPRRNNEKPMSP